VSIGGRLGAAPQESIMVSSENHISLLLVYVVLSMVHDEELDYTYTAIVTCARHANHPRISSSGRSTNRKDHIEIPRRYHRQQEDAPPFSEVSSSGL
jgi:hypothetical protein